MGENSLPTVSVAKPTAAPTVKSASKPTAAPAKPASTSPAPAKPTPTKPVTATPKPVMPASAKPTPTKPVVKPTSIAKTEVAKKIPTAPVQKQVEPQEEAIDYKSLGVTKKVEGVTKEGKKFLIPKPGEPLNLPPVPQLPPEPEPTPKTVENKFLIESMLYMKQNKLMRENKSTMKYDTVKEAEGSAIEDIVSAMTEKLNTLKSDISELQKKGSELKLEGIKLLEIPLKIRVWKSTLNKKDIIEMYKIFNIVESKTAPLKDLQVKKDKNHEDYLKKKEDWLAAEKERAIKRHKETLDMGLKPKPAAKPVSKQIAKTTIQKPKPVAKPTSITKTEVAKKIPVAQNSKPTIVSKK